MSRVHMMEQEALSMRNQLMLGPFACRKPPFERGSSLTKRTMSSGAPLAEDPNAKTIENGLAAAEKAFASIPRRWNSGSPTG